MDCYYCGNAINGISVNGKHPECAIDQGDHRREGVIFSRQNVASWLRQRAESIKGIAGATGKSIAMVAALSGAADAIENGAISRWVRKRDESAPYACKCAVCEHIRNRQP